MKSLISVVWLLCLLAILDNAFPKCSGKSVTWICQNQFGSLSHLFFWLSSVHWHTFSIESSACPSLHPFVSFTSTWSRLWGIFFIALKYALTCSTFWLACIGGRSSMNFMGSVSVPVVVPSMTLTALFTLSRFIRFVCAIIVRLSPCKSMTLSTFWYSSKRWQCSVPFAAIILQGW